ncbi:MULTISPECIES: DeoR/GlpR family DNA-binding transcription regulator [Micrococcaceae]|uniref:Lactose phosphotransferase system repressor n=1 Tax=Arthrobacter rhombi TaxID=71253 RepID=A0A1R4FC50_9MICC|nr:MULTISPECIES: DeoR/GlpR family DNA-binding transcription regulator [Micrococcaceae]PCC24240.1 DeoR/GlpR transcriptional regulator [Glutamicibacter sp. BW78]SJM53423.1 Transcriptional repressor of the fructose operon, DeoR family [Arthrobacter rhombi]
MFAEERHRVMGDRVASQGRVTVAELAQQLDITRETVRRDLAQLEQEGILRRVHGGAVATRTTSTVEESLSVRTSLNHEQKSRIAAAAVELLPAGATSVVLDAGTTTELFAQAMGSSLGTSRAADLLVLTHSVPVAYRVAASGSFQLEVIGGRVRALTSAATGASTIDQFRALRPDIAFIGANGIDADFGLSTPDPLEAAVKSAIVACARRVVVLADSSKLGEQTLIRFAALDQVDTLVTDTAPGPDLAAALERADVDVTLA